MIVAQVLGAVGLGAPPAELVEVAQGRRDVLEAARVVAERGGSMRAPVPEHAERLGRAIAQSDA